MGRILSTAGFELRVARRNRWVLIAVALMVVLSLVLSAAGSAPSGSLGADRLSVVVASLTSLAVYLIPLLALLMSFDAIAGEKERGTLPLVLVYPIARWELLAGKFCAHLCILLLALVAGYAVAAAVTLVSDRSSLAGLSNLWRLTWTSTVLGASFLGIGYTLSAMARRVSGAAGLAVGLWLGFVVLYDLGLLAAVVADDGGRFTTSVFPVALLINPADAFRLFNLTAADASGAVGGVGGAAATIPLWQSRLSVLLWPWVAMGMATLTFRRVVAGDG